jgi:ribosomal protein L25 (general stress protein Ctc)
MTAFTIEAQERDTSRNPRQLRAAGLTPATIYGKNVEAKSIQLPAHAFRQAYLKGHDVFTLEGLGVTAKAHQIQIHAVSREVLNVEFLVTPA